MHAQKQTEQILVIRLFMLFIVGGHLSHFSQNQHVNYYCHHYQWQGNEKVFSVI